MKKQYLTSYDYLDLYQIKYEKNAQTQAFLLNHDLNRIKRYFPYSKNDWQDIQLDKIAERVYFDDYLRTILFELVSSMEITLKSVLTNAIFYCHNDKYVYNKNTFFQSAVGYKLFKKMVRLVKETADAANDLFLTRYFQDNKRVKIPIAALIQRMTLGEVITFLESIHIGVQNRVLSYYPFENTAALLTNLNCAKAIRNASCHMDVLLNKKYPLKPAFSKKEKEKIHYPSLDSERLFIQLLNLQRCCLDEQKWRDTIARLSERVIRLTKDKILKPRTQYGFPKDWQQLLTKTTYKETE